jgi:hypothetical protein
LVVYLPLWKIWKSVGIILPNISRNYPGTPQACTACMGATLSLGIDQVYTSLLWEQYGMLMVLWENSWLVACPTTLDDGPTGPQRNVHISQNYPIISKLNKGKDNCCQQMGWTQNAASNIARHVR